MANENRLIDAVKLVIKLSKKVRFGRIEYDDMLAVIADTPTVDAVEVVHAEWGDIYTCHGERLWGYRCSQCEADNSKKSNYCPNCGAKMDGGSEDG